MPEFPWLCRKWESLFCSTNEELQATLQELDDLREQLAECTLEVQQLQEEKQVGGCWEDNTPGFMLR